MPLDIRKYASPDATEALDAAALGPVPEGALHLSGFLHFRQAHGGVKRSRQIAALLQARGAQTVTLPNGHGPAVQAALRAPRSTLRALAAALGPFRRGLSPKGFAIATAYGAWLLEILRVERPSVVYQEVTPNIGMALGTLLSALGVRFVALPHNVEFLVPGQRQSYFRSQAAAFDAEARLYRGAERVLAISDFDRAVIRSLGASDVALLPFEPVGADRAALRRIAARRRTAETSGFLILGSTGNPPTELGLERLLREIGESPRSRSFVLAGFGTEKFAALAPPAVTVRGSVSNEALETLLTDCEGLIVYQPPTSGFLTRISEAVLAGVPVYVLGGYLQARGLEALNVHAIETLAELP